MTLQPQSTSFTARPTIVWTELQLSPQDSLDAYDCLDGIAAAAHKLHLDAYNGLDKASSIHSPLLALDTNNGQRGRLHKELRSP